MADEEPLPSARFRWIWAGAALAAVAALLALGWRAARGRGKAQPIAPTMVYAAGPSPTLDLATFLTALPNVPIGAATPEPWDGRSPFYLLLLGVDDRPWVENWGPPRSDTLVVLAYHPETQQVGVLSLPRDLMVSVPEWPAYPQKLNMAFAAGFAQGGPHAGARYALRVVNELLGLEVRHYAAVNYTAFVQAIDALDGVVVDVPEPMVIGLHDPRSGAYKPVRLKPGRQALNGDMALGYVRFRADANGDFGRMARQQQVLLGVYARLKQPQTWQRLLTDAPLLYNRLRNGVWTNLTLHDGVRLGWQVRSVPREHFHFAVVTQEQAPATMINGVYVLQPQRDALRALAQRVLVQPQPATPTPTPVPVLRTPWPTPTLRPSPTPTPDLWPTARAELARIALYNAAGAPGLACRTAAFLRHYGFWVVETGNAAYQERSSIVNAAAKPATLALLQQMLGIPDGQVVHVPALEGEAEIAVYLGADWATQNPLPPRAEGCE